MCHGEWYSVTKSPEAIIARLRTFDCQDMICLTAAGSGGELWLRAGQIDAIAAMAPEDDEPLDVADEALAEVLAEFEAEEVGRIIRPGCERRRRRLAPRLRGEHG
jgi:hypothetical protein